MIDKIRFSFLFLGLVLISNNTFAFCDIKIEQQNPLNSTNRLALAKSLHKEVNRIYEAIPNLSPSQEKWLGGEISSKDPFRRLKALDSDESNLKNTKEQLKSLRDALNVLKNNNDLTKKQEILIWLSVANELKNIALAWNISELVNRKLIIIRWDKRYKERDVIGMCSNTIGREIILNIVAADIMSVMPD